MHARLSALLLVASLGHALAAEPQPPCGGRAFPAYPELGQPPITRVWSERDRDWAPPLCTGWKDRGFTTLVATAATFRHRTGLNGLLRRMGAISDLTGVRYWSTTHGRWQTLIVGAHALAGSSMDRGRADFSPDELTAGKTLRFEQKDNLSGKAVYRLRVLEVAPGRLVFETENVTPIRYWGKTLFGPGDLQSIYFFERQGQDAWRYYSLARTGARASRLTSGHEASSINRAVAFYRHYAGMPTDQEPPAAR